MSSAIGDVYYGAGIDPLYANSRSRHQFYDSSIGRPMLPDVQFRVPMESRRDVDKVKDALDIDGVRGVNCDLVTQTVTVSGNVPYHRLLKKLKHVKRKSRLISFIPDNQAYNPSYGYQANPYTTSYGSSSYGRVPIRRPLSPRITAPLHTWLILWRSVLTMKITKIIGLAGTLIFKRSIEVHVGYTGDSLLRIKVGSDE